MYAKSLTTITNILEAAQRLFVEKNYADVTMTDIARQADVTKGALYHHFSGKEDLYIAMMLEGMAQKKTLMQAAVARQGSCRERLYQLTYDFLSLPADQRGIMRLVRRDINIFKDPIREKLIRAYQEALPEQVEAIIKDGIRDGELADMDPRLLAWEYVAMVEVALSNYAQSILQTKERMTEYVLHLFFNGAKHPQ